MPLNSMLQGESASIIKIIIVIILDYILGDPPNWPHPIRYIGLSISKYEKIIRKSGVNLKIGGFVLVFLSLVTALISSTIILKVANLIHPILEAIIIIYLLYTCIAAKCLDIEAKKVHNAVYVRDIQRSRKQLSYLVGRDTSQLSFEEVIRGVVETVAENTVDGVLAPLFYMMIGFYFGYPVHFAISYKVINTLDSMVGYIQEPYKEIGYASAKLDDIVNYIPARIGSLLMILSGGLLGYNMKQGFRILVRDRKNHKSPNCGYPEAAVAGLLGIQLGGTNTYFGEKLYKPTIGDSITCLREEHITNTIKIMYGAELLSVLVFISIYI